MKEKTKDRLKSWCMTLGFAFAIGLCAFATSCDQKVQITSAYSVNQQEESVIFTKEELNNCNYSYLYNVSDIDDTTIEDSYILYNGFTYTIHDNDFPNYVIYTTNGQNTTIKFQSGLWFLSDEQNFDYPLTIYSDFFADNMAKQTTLTASQLNHNTYTYFGSVDLSDDHFVNSYLIYNNEVFLHDNSHNYEVSYDSVSSDLTIEFNDDSDTWSLCDYVEGDFDIGFNYSVTFYSTYIHDNLFSPDQYQNNFGNALTDFIQIITSGLVSFARGVANGIIGMASALFLDTGSLSVFGGIVAIFAGLALAVGITTKVYTWVTSLGN